LKPRISFEKLTRRRCCGELQQRATPRTEPPAFETLCRPFRELFSSFGLFLFGTVSRSVSFRPSGKLEAACSHMQRLEGGNLEGVHLRLSHPITSPKHARSEASRDFDHPGHGSSWNTFRWYIWAVHSAARRRFFSRASRDRRPEGCSNVRLAALRLTVPLVQRPFDLI